MLNLKKNAPNLSRDKKIIKSHTLKDLENKLSMQTENEIQETSSGSKEKDVKNIEFLR